MPLVLAALVAGTGQLICDNRSLQDPRYFLWFGPLFGAAGSEEAGLRSGVTEGLKRLAHSAGAS